MERGGKAGAWKLERLRVEGDAGKFGNQINSIEQGRCSSVDFSEGERSN